MFETLLVLDGRPIELERHLARLGASVGELYGAAPPVDAAELVSAGAAGVATGRLRVTLVPRGSGDAPISLGTAAGGIPTSPADSLVADVLTAVVDAALVLPGWERAIVLEAVEVPGGLGAHKWADRDLLARLEPDPAARVALLCDSDGTVLEGSRGNVFAVRAGRLSTPPLDGRILPGIARAVAIEEARGAGLEVVEEKLTLDDLGGAEEVFTTGSVRGVEPVRSVVGRGEWSPGTVAPLVAERLRRRWSAAGATAALAD